MSAAHGKKEAFKNLPEEARNLSQWVNYNLKTRENGKKDKVPIDARSGRPISITDPRNFRTFAEVVEAVEQGLADGIGFAFTEQDSFFGIDGDKCINPETLELTPEGAAIFQRFSTYGESTPSGLGFHLIGKGKLPGGGGKKGNIKIYDQDRFFTMTGNRLPNTPHTINPCPELDAFYREVFAHKLKPPTNGSSYHPPTGDTERAKLLADLDGPLDYIPAIDHEMWLSVGMAVHSVSPDETGLGLWVEWSKKCEEKFDLNDCLKRWRSFKPDGGITAATIFGLAKQHGWQNGKAHLREEGDSLPPEAFADDAREEKIQGDNITLKQGEFCPVVRCAKDIEPEIVKYLWYPYLPLSKLGLLGGDSGAGKTYLTAALATAHSKGTWPYFLNGKESVKEPGNTLIFSAEDGIADTYIPRLINLGADLKRIHFVEGKKDWKGNLHRVVLNDKLIIKRCIEDHGAKLVMFDPLQSFLPPKTKMNEMESVRPVLDALIEAAYLTGCHILLVGHLSKAKQETASYKFLGSVDWFNASRSAMLVTKNPENPDTERLFYHVKNSLGPKSPGMGFSISGENEPIFLWGHTVEATIEEVFAGNAKQNPKLEEAEEFLRGELSFGEQSAEDIQESAKRMKISRRVLWDAKKKLKGKARKEGYQGRWLWSLPT